MYLFLCCPLGTSESSASPNTANYTVTHAIEACLILVFNHFPLSRYLIIPKVGNCTRTVMTGHPAELDLVLALFT